MKNLFNTVKMTKPKRNLFDLSHDVKLSCNMGKLVPTMCIEAVPGDKFNISCESLLRFAPLVSPVMHRMDVYMHYFFVPHRLLWDNWKNYITNTLVGGVLPAHPYLTVDNANWSSVHDYLGIPQPPIGSSANINAMPFSAYQMIYNEYYRDQNLIAEVPYALVDGDNTGNSDLWRYRNRAWEHDYFTASLPFAQKGSAVDIPLGDVVLNPDWDAEGNEPKFVKTNGTPAGGIAGVPVQSRDNPSYIFNSLGENPLAYDPNGSLEVGSTTINDLRRAFRLQEWLEKAARGGSRYIESILMHFGVRSSDKRLQRPEYITGTKSPVVISEVLNTTGTVDAPQGNMAGHGFSVTGGKYGNYYCEEFGYIVGIMSIMPKTAYQQGISRQFLKINDPFEQYWPSFANIGEQPVLQREIWGYSATPNATFGYVPRYAEYKFQSSRVAGQFRSTLDFWHLGRIFSSEPALNQSFVECDPDTRIFAVTNPDDDHLYAHIMHKVSASRLMPKFGTPSF